jgi:hypothetical protein
MLKRTTAGVVLLGVLLPLGYASAENMTTVQDLREACKSIGNNSDGIFCLGYIGGTADTMVLIGVGLTSDTTPLFRHSFGICQNSPSTYGADAQVFINWADRHPEKWTDHMQSGVITALAETWPCPMN